MAKINKTKKQAELVDHGKVILITGAAGYIGSMLADQFSQSPDIKEVIAIDTRPEPELLHGNKKIHWVSSDLSTGDWCDAVAKKEPELVIHSAWRVGELDGDQDSEITSKNMISSEKIFDFSFNSPFIKKIVYVSSVTAYGAFENNNREKFFVEGDMLREDNYPFGEEKKNVEAMLAKKYADSNRTKNVFVVRPPTITGPMGRCILRKEDFAHLPVNIMSYVPIASEDWGRQYVHEDDFVNIIAILSLNNIPLKGYQVFNIAPRDIVFGKEIAEILDMETISMPPLIIRLFLAIVGYSNERKMSVASRGAWKYFSYPIFVNGEKVSKVLKYPYMYSSKEAIEGVEGRYDHMLSKTDAVDAGATEQ